MNEPLVAQIAHAVLYEGYMLYPYRPSVKNRQRWTFGGLYPQAYSQAQEPPEASEIQTECLGLGDRNTVLTVSVRFLHLVDRQVREFDRPMKASHPSSFPPLGGGIEGGSVAGRAGQMKNPLQLPLGKGESFLSSFPPLGGGIEGGSESTRTGASGTPSDSPFAMGRVLGDALSDRPDPGEPPGRNVESLRVGDAVHYSWQEAVERKIELGESDLGALVAQPRRGEFAFEAGTDREPLQDAGGTIVGMIVRRRYRLDVSVELAAEAVGEGVFRVSVKVTNRTPFADATAASRDEALMHGLVSTHTVLGVRDGEFVSMIDPPEPLRALASDCRNVGAWPVLVGAEGERDTMLSAPIILYDYPRIAPESPGDLFDATEIDEILTLRIMTLTDEEKQAMSAVDERARAVLERTEALAREQLMGLHGTVRGLRPITEEQNHG